MSTFSGIMDMQHFHIGVWSFYFSPPSIYNLLDGWHHQYNRSSYRCVLGNSHQIRRCKIYLVKITAPSINKFTIIFYIYNLIDLHHITIFSESNTEFGEESEKSVSSFLVNAPSQGLQGKLKCSCMDLDRSVFQRVVVMPGFNNIIQRVGGRPAPAQHRIIIPINNSLLNE